MKLSQRETEVLEKVSQGLTTPKIAEELFLGVKTIETHRKNIIKKLNSNNIVEAVVKAMRKGIIQ